MADGKEDGGSWWGSWLQAAKEKSASALEFVKKDLADYTCTMQQDTTQVIALTTEKMKEMQAQEGEGASDKPRFGFSSFLENLTKSLVVEAEDKHAPPIPVPNTDPMFDRAKARLHAVQIDPGTYCNEPSGDPAMFQAWVKNFSIDEMKGDISELLVSKVEVRALYTKLVPSEISHADFWQRYFYKVNQLHLDEARKMALMKRAERAEIKEDSISWDDSDDEEAKDVKDRLKVEQPNKSVKERLSPETDKIRDEVQEAKKKSDRISEDKSESEVLDKKITPNVDSDKSSLQDSISLTDKEIKPDVSVECNTVGTEDKCEKKTTEIVDIDTKIKQEESVDETKVVKEQKKDDMKNIENESRESADRTSLDINVKEKGDVVVVNPDRESPSSESDGKKDAVSTDDDWEQDFDVELTEEDMKAADEIAKKLNLSAADYTKLAGDVDEDWESWE